MNEKMETRMIEGRDYFFLFPDGDVVPAPFTKSRADKKRLAWGNCFATRAEAEAARERVRAALKGESGGASAESTATQLALQDAEKALSRTLNERDKLRALRDAMEKALYEAHEFLGRRKRELEQLSATNAELAARNVELRTKIEHLRYDVAYWRGEAEAQERLIDVLAKDNELLTAKRKAKR